MDSVDVAGGIVGAACYFAVVYLFGSAVIFVGEEVAACMFN